MLAVSITSKKVRNDLESSVPTVVRLARGEVQQRTQDMLLHVIVNVSEDPLLPHTIFTDLLQTQVHVIARFQEYSGYPWVLWKMSKKYNFHGVVLFAEEFLREDVSSLDVGFSLPLRAEALQFEGHARKLEHLLGDHVQNMIDGMLEKTEASSLDAERRHAQDRRSCKRDRVMSLARGSRNSILQTYRTWRMPRLNSRQKQRKVAWAL